MLNKPMLGVVLVLVCQATLCFAEKSTIRITGGPFGESLPFVILANHPDFSADDISVSFIPWHSPDQMRALIAGGQADGAIITTLGAYMLHKKGLQTTIAAFYGAPLWVVSTSDARATTLSCLKGVMLFPFGPRDMPKLLFKAAAEGLDLPIITKHTGSALEAVSYLLLKRADHALLSEPTATTAVVRSAENVGETSPLLIKDIDLRDYWQKKFNGRKMLVSCFALFDDATSQPERIRRLVSRYRQAALWSERNPDQALALAKNVFPALGVLLAKGVISAADIRVYEGRKAIADAIFFLNKMTKGSAVSDHDPLQTENLFLVTP